MSEWQQFWDAEQEAHFYFSAKTGKVSWREPKEGFTPAVCFIGDNMVDVMVAVQAAAR